MTARSVLCFATLFACVLATPRVSAQGGTDEAERLFTEGRELLEAGRYAEACPKLERSERLAPTGKALLNLADCYAKNGQTASAHAAFVSAADRALAAGRRDIEDLARSRARELERRLSTLTIRVATPVANLAITRDDVPLPQASWGVTTPVDPGTHVVTAHAPGSAPWTVTVNVGPDHDGIVVDIPKLGADGGTTPKTPPSSPESSSQRTLGLVVSGIGLLALAAGTASGIVAISKHSSVKTKCPNNVCPNDEARDAADSTNRSSATFGTVSTVSFIAGAALLASGAVLFFTSPRIQAGAAPTAGGGYARVDVRF